MGLALALGCGGGSKDSDGASESDGLTEAMTGMPTEGTADGTTGSHSQRPSGQSCTLVGFFVACEGGGQTFCDEIDGALRFGPCIDAPVCELSGSATCDMRCELVDGVPTWIPDDGCMTSGASDSG